MSERYDGREIVGLDLHRHRTVMVRMTPGGERLEVMRFTNDPAVLEATYSWYWAADVLAAAGASVHLAHPLGVKGFAYRRVKNDVRDATDLADLLRMGQLPEAWIAPPPVRARRELMRHRHKLIQAATSLKAQVYAVLAKCGLRIAVSDLFGVSGSRQLRELPLPEPFRARVNSQLRLLAALEAEIARSDGLIPEECRGDVGYRVIQRIDGIGPVLAAVLVTELGDVTRFSAAPAVCSWAGLTPKHRESDLHVHRYGITKQGSRLVRWAAIEAVQCAPVSSPKRRTYDRIVARRGGTGRNLAKVAAARRLLTLAYYGLRDGEIRCLAAATA
jgi:transposase